MADEDILKRICDETGASLDEALFYLEGFNWDLVDATEACRKKILPRVKVKSSPEVSVNVKAAAEESSAMIHPPRISIRFPSEPARMMDPYRGSNQSQWQEPPHETQKELIDRFREVAPELSPQEAIDILRRLHWNVEQAASDFMERKFSQHNSDSDDDDPPVFDRRHIPTTGVSNSAGFSSQDETSVALAMDVMRQRVPPLPGLPSESQLVASMEYSTQGQTWSFSPCSMNVQSDEEYIPPIPITYSSQVQMESSSPLPPLRPLMIGSRRIQPEQLPPEEEQLSPEVQNERIHTVIEATKTSPEVALSYLRRCKWNANNAINYILDDSSGDLNSLRISEEDHSTIGQSNSQRSSEGDRSTTEFSEDVSSRALASMRLQNIPPPVPPMGSPSQSQIQAPQSSSFSMMNVDPTETEESLNKASDESVPVAISPMASPQVDSKLKGKAVAEDSSTETIPGDITLTIILADDGSGKTLEIPLRSDQTIRDIRNAIDEQTPENDRDYYLQSMSDNVDCTNMNVTVGMIIKGGSTMLLQVFPDP